MAVRQEHACSVWAPAVCPHGDISGSEMHGSPSLTVLGRRAVVEGFKLMDVGLNIRIQGLILLHLFVMQSTSIPNSSRADLKNAIHLSKPHTLQRI